MQIRRKFILMFALGAASICSVNGATITAIASGNWSSNATWSCGCQPTNADNLIIPAGITVTMSGPAILFLGPVITITIYGTLVLNNASLQIDASDIVSIKAGGKISATGLTGGSIYSGVIPMFMTNGSSIVGPKTITNGTLPVTLTSFTGRYEQHTVILDWVSASELNFDHYEISRAADGRNYEIIGTITSAGNSTQNVEYSFTDSEPLINNFYRLTTVDIDGTATVYKTIAVETGMPMQFEVYPNPVTEDRLFVKMNFIPTGNEALTLYDCLGVKIMQSQAMEENISAFVFDKQLQKGIYYLLLDTGSTVFKTKVVVQ